MGNRKRALSDVGFNGGDDAVAQSEKTNVGAGREDSGAGERYLGGDRRGRPGGRGPNRGFRTRRRGDQGPSISTAAALLQQISRKAPLGGNGVFGRELKHQLEHEEILNEKRQRFEEGDELKKSEYDINFEHLFPGLAKSRYRRDGELQTADRISHGPTESGRHSIIARICYSCSEYVDTDPAELSNLKDEHTPLLLAVLDFSSGLDQELVSFEEIHQDVRVMLEAMDDIVANAPSKESLDSGLGFGKQKIQARVDVLAQHVCGLMTAFKRIYVKVRVIPALTSYMQKKVLLQTWEAAHLMLMEILVLKSDQQGAPNSTRSDVEDFP
ncbi:hypothetical protein CLAIMM_09792 [Cladophialophora immunda]|nr:hypothetical protein CLAIMM_09792 [Cladophialophora immunda]